MTKNGIGSVRLTAGRWRGRRLPVVEADGLRPTGNRVRETLFNWLQPYIGGASCLDLFAGTGALGFEALSRHARQVVFVEPDVAVCKVLKQSCAELGVVAQSIQLTSQDSLLEQADAEVRIYSGSAEDYLIQNSNRFDVVFVDPPFAHSVQWRTVEALISDNLTDSAFIYVESPSNMNPPEPLPTGCCVHREKLFGDVCARLLRTTSL
jgi:16S rRNA (guanine966-N2)-methyltransferase